MTINELAALKVWRQHPRCPCTRIATTPEGKTIRRTYLHDDNGNRLWTEPSRVIEEIKQCYRGVYRITVDASFGILVTKTVLWEDLYPSDSMLPKIENPAPPITKVLMGEWVSNDGTTTDPSLDGVMTLRGEPDFRLSLGLDKIPPR